MTKEEFRLSATMSILPVNADMLEDMPFTQRAKQIKNDVVNTIRKQDKFFMDGAEVEVWEQQNEIGRLYRQWLDSIYENFKDIK
jgi:hypothetical protein